MLRLTRIRPGQWPLWEPASALWLETRREAMRETGANVEPCLTELASQDELLVATLGGEVVGAYAWRRALAEDLALLPSDVAQQLEREHPDLLAAGHLCVAPAHRRRKIPDALVTASLERLAEGPETAIVVRTRDSRNVHRLALRHGGAKVGECTSYGEPSSVFVFTAQPKKPRPTPLSSHGK